MVLYKIFYRDFYSFAMSHSEDSFSCSSLESDNITESNLEGNIWTTRASVSPGYPNTRKQCMKTRARSASIFKHCFRMFGHPSETRTRVVYMASQINRDVTECFRLLIWIEFLTKHNVIWNSIQVILHA
jgi:hypothetical protein